MPFLFEQRSERISEEVSNHLRVAYLFQPDTTLPFQYSETLRRKTHLGSEKRLMFAVLEDAVSSFQKYHLARNKKGKELFRDVEKWITEEKDDWLFTFRNICESLEINPDYLRQGLLKWKEGRGDETQRETRECHTFKRRFSS